LIIFKKWIFSKSKGKKNPPLINGWEGAMKDQDKTKETLIRELEELRLQIGFLKNKLSEKNSENKVALEHDTQKLSKKELWRLPGYWH
jgi:hypothetical protein